ncbi:MAG: tetratricopeptide repeat protein [candidate division WOR-3 bacterium]
MPDDANGFFQEGITLYQRGEYENAEIAFRRALERDPTLAEARMALGETLYSLGRYEDSEAEFRAVVRMRPESPAA